MKGNIKVKVKVGSYASLRSSSQASYPLDHGGSTREYKGEGKERKGKK